MNILYIISILLISLAILLWLSLQPILVNASCALGKKYVYSTNLECGPFKRQLDQVMLECCQGFYNLTDFLSIFQKYN